jgi:hypothetical protein
MPTLAAMGAADAGRVRRGGVGDAPALAGVPSSYSGSPVFDGAGQTRRLGCPL